jgi:hypothetical protein
MHHVLRCVDALQQEALAGLRWAFLVGRLGLGVLANEVRIISSCKFAHS